jgi:hypothetical protein
MPGTGPQTGSLGTADTSGVDWKNETTPKLTLFIQWRVRKGDVGSKVHQRI